MTYPQIFMYVYKEDIISVWNRMASDQATTTRIRDTLRRVLNLPPNTILEYKNHTDSLKYGMGAPPFKWKQSNVLLLFSLSHFRFFFRHPLTVQHSGTIPAFGILTCLLDKRKVVFQLEWKIKSSFLYIVVLIYFHLSTEIINFCFTYY